jgi:protein gp37
LSNLSKIEWTEATWNPTTGCTKISEGCKNCYAEKMSKRLKLMGVKKYRKQFEFSQHEDDVDLPLKWKKPRKIFVNSMSDLFHENSDLTFVGRCFLTMSQSKRHVFQILTKRPKKMFEYSIQHKRFFGTPIDDNIWLGTSVENKKNVYRIDHLRKIECAIKFVSFEPLIGSVGKIDLTNIQWVIIGGESGPKYRPVKEEWVQEIISQCKEQNVKVFFKQWGGFRPKSHGREINGRTYDEFPKIKSNKLLING